MLKLLLSPFSLAYGIIATVRNKLFDCGVFKSKTYDMPVVSVGNITVGGTGKTPHVEYLVRLLSDKCRLAVVSRGYGRSTTGYAEVASDAEAQSVGDEPLQIKRKFPNVTVAVDEVRTHAIDKLLCDNRANVFILDDAFQHRYVKAGLNIVLVDYNRPIFSDSMLPAGRLREPSRNIDRSDIVIVTKCPKSLSEQNRTEFASRLGLTKGQSVCFTAFAYSNLVPIVGCNPVETLNGVEMLVVTGISQPERMYQYLQNNGAVVHKLRFTDHHRFTCGDMQKIKNAYTSLKNDNAIVVFTEKDVARLTSQMINQLEKLPIYCLPIAVEFIYGGSCFDSAVTKFCLSEK